MKFFFKKLSTLILLCSGLIATGCSDTNNNNRSDYKIISEASVFIFPLEGEISLREAEFSGLAWFNDDLILLPQYPQMYGEESDGALFIINRAQLDSSLNTKGAYIPKAQKTKIDFNGLDSDLLSHGSGFESIVFNGSDVYLTIESYAFFNTTGYIIKGEITGNANIKLLPETLKEIKAQTKISNLSEESIFIKDSLVITIYEGNGLNINARPVANVFNLSLDHIGINPLDNIEYRITDATQPDEKGNFWVINYMWPEDEKDLLPTEDDEFKKFGIGKSHRNSYGVERLIELNIAEQKISRTTTAPIYLENKLKPGGRNWEGIVRYKRGFLLVTDKYPKTILAFVQPNN